eukprot:CAMPEP_0170603208 /NCGR_PEP_ID=MMETSP0224-20130122/18792_1 /TAXON_ID=285029 /ORGANISM="Togula jolla, Strain CCCM 725" /LENGTH=336 /DNA_ID=CAMNT_0010928079 /DNA_START=119 /DNA_END=1126 /DNA_ORIENTATION=-
MAPLEDLQARDLAWISDFVTQQVLLMLRPMMEHLQQTDAMVDYAQHTVQRLNMDVSEVRIDIERTNRCLAILRQGLGVQNEGKCALQRGLEETVRNSKRLDEQMEGLCAGLRGMEDTVGSLSNDVRSASVKYEDLTRQVAMSTSGLEDLRCKVERTVCDTHAKQTDLLNNSEVWQRELRELRELRRHQLGIAKMEEKGLPTTQGRSLASDSWPKKNFAPELSNGGGCAGSEKCSSGESQQSKRTHHSGLCVPQESHPEFGGQLQSPKKPSRSGFRIESGDDSRMIPGVGEDPSSSSRLPLLARQSGMSRPPDTSEGPRLRFSATMDAAARGDCHRR